MICFAWIPMIASVVGGMLSGGGGAKGAKGGGGPLGGILSSLLQPLKALFAGEMNNQKVANKESTDNLPRS